MRNSSRPSRTPSKLSDSVHHQVSMYALAASAAGVGVLAFVQSAEAKIIYTHTHHVIKDHNTHFNLDLNHDGKTDFVFGNTTSCQDGCIYYLGIHKPGKPGPGNSVIGYRTVWNNASALKSGARIGPGGRFDPFYHVLAGTGVGGPLGKWRNVKNRYLGLRFKIRGKTHYGWARLSVTVNGNVITGTLTGYAYETIPGKAIIAGKTKDPDVITFEPVGLGRLAQGSAGLTARRLGK